MKYSDKVSETWRHLELGNAAHDYKGLVRYATLAASSHNTQPWKFKLEPNRIVILPDLSRRCPAVDPDDHHLYASLGCAAENILVAAPAFGLKGQYSYDESASSVQIDLEETLPSGHPCSMRFQSASAAESNLTEHHFLLSKSVSLRKPRVAMGSRFCLLQTANKKNR